MFQKLITLYVNDPIVTMVTVLNTLTHVQIFANSERHIMLCAVRATSTFESAVYSVVTDVF